MLARLLLGCGAPGATGECVPQGEFWCEGVEKDESYPVPASDPVYDPSDAIMERPALVQLNQNQVLQRRQENLPYMKEASSELPSNGNGVGTLSSIFGSVQGKVAEPSRAHHGGWPEVPYGPDGKPNFPQEIVTTSSAARQQPPLSTGPITPSLRHGHQVADSAAIEADTKCKPLVDIGPIGTSKSVRVNVGKPRFLYGWGDNNVEKGWGEELPKQRAKEDVPRKNDQNSRPKNHQERNVSPIVVHGIETNASGKVVRAYTTGNYVQANPWEAFGI